MFLQKKVMKKAALTGPPAALLFQDPLIKGIVGQQQGAADKDTSDHIGQPVLPAEKTEENGQDHEDLEAGT